MIMFKRLTAQASYVGFLSASSQCGISRKLLFFPETLVLELSYLWLVIKIPFLDVKNSLI